MGPKNYLGLDGRLYDAGSSCSLASAPCRWGSGEGLINLRGAAAGVGAFGLAELARVAETELREGAPVNPERIDDLDMAVQEVSAFISDRLKSRRAA